MLYFFTVVSNLFWLIWSSSAVYSTVGTGRGSIFWVCRWHVKVWPLIRKLYIWAVLSCGIDWIEAYRIAADNGITFGSSVQSKLPKCDPLNDSYRAQLFRGAVCFRVLFSSELLVTNKLYSHWEFPHWRILWCIGWQGKSFRCSLSLEGQL